MKNLSKLFAVMLPALGMSIAHANVRVIDFDTDAQGNAITHGQIVDNEYADWGVQITSVAENDPKNPIQVAFDTNETGTSDGDLEFNNPSNSYNSELVRTGEDLTDYESNFSYTSLEIDGYGDIDSPGNVLIIQNVNKRDECNELSCKDPDDQARPAGYFEFKFDFLVNIISLDTFDFDETNLLTAQFFDAKDDEIKNGFVFQDMVDGGFLRQDVNVSGVKRLVLNLPGSGAIDNLAFKEVSGPASLGLLGFALLLMVRRARK